MPEETEVVCKNDRIREQICVDLTGKFQFKKKPLLFCVFPFNFKMTNIIDN